MAVAALSAAWLAICFASAGIVALVYQVLSAFHTQLSFACACSLDKHYSSTLKSQVQMLATSVQNVYLSAAAISGQKGSVAEHIAGSRSTGSDRSEAVQVAVDRPKALVGRRAKQVG